MNFILHDRGVKVHDSTASNMSDAEIIEGLRGTIESQKQTHDAIIKKYKALEEVNSRALNALTKIAEGTPPSNNQEAFIWIDVARDIANKALSDEPPIIVPCEHCDKTLDLSIEDTCNNCGKSCFGSPEDYK